MSEGSCGFMHAHLLGDFSQDSILQCRLHISGEENLSVLGQPSDLIRVHFLSAAS